jgi:hypothetical protein
MERDERKEKSVRLKKRGLIPWIFEGHWCKGTWEDYINGLYKGPRIAFRKP